MISIEVLTLIDLLKPISLSAITMHPVSLMHLVFPKSIGKRMAMRGPEILVMTIGTSTDRGNARITSRVEHIVLHLLIVLCCDIRMKLVQPNKCSV